MSFARQTASFLCFKIQARPSSSYNILQELISPNVTKSQNQFDCQIFKHGPGTRERPNIIPSSCTSRIVGCICEENSRDINFMQLYKGALKRCECGHWFKLEEYKK